LTLLWLFVMDRALKSYEEGVPLFSIRYEDLDAKRPETLRALFEYCKLPTDQVPIGLRAFERDAQEGTFLARENPAEGNILTLTPEQLAQVRAVLARHPVINTPDYILPGTLKVSADPFRANNYQVNLLICLLRANRTAAVSLSRA
jgi:hypothetical protein